MFHFSLNLCNSYWETGFDKLAYCTNFPADTKDDIQDCYTRTKRADLQQICNRSVLTKTDQLQTTLSSAESVFSLLQTLSLNTLRDVNTADAEQTNNRSADYLQQVEAQKLILSVKLCRLICYSIRK